MAGVLFDTSVYVRAFRSADDALVRVRNLSANQPVWLSSVVLEELYAGIDEADLAIIEKLEYDFDKVGRLLVPNLNDWTSTGKALAYLRSKFDYEPVGRGRITNDALIAMSAARTGIVVLTENEKDFARLAKFRPFAWRMMRA